MTRFASKLAAALVLLAPAALAQVDDFDGGANPNGWTFAVSSPDVIEPSGGNPGGWLHNPTVDSFAPILQIGAGGTSAFVGDLRAKRVTRLGLDAITNSATFGADGRNLAVLLRDTKGTPLPDDDDYAYSVGPLVPQVGQGWTSYSFDVPSQSTAAVPAGWTGGWTGDLAQFRPGVEWSDVIQSVDRVEIWWIDPSFFAIFQQWDVGVDNLLVETAIGSSFCAGIPNTTGFVGTASATGSATAMDNDLTLIANRLPANQFGIWLASRLRGFPPGPSCSVGLCIGGMIGRLDGPGQVLSTGAAGSFALRVDLTMIPKTNGAVAVLPGDTWNFQAWHRDTNSCGWAFSTAVEVVFL